MLSQDFQPAQWPEVGSERLASTILGHSPQRGGIALVGLPDDLGVRLNAGRAGAAAGPTAFRAALARFSTRFDAASQRLMEVPIFDAGDVAPTEGDDPATLARTHERITQALREVHVRGMTACCVGGGHDLTFPAVRALAQEQGGAVGGVNIDTHLDVRDTPGSGMPFRALIDGGHLDPRRFSVLGAGRFASTQEHWTWLHARDGAVVMAADLADDPKARAERAFTRLGQGHSFVSFDLDVLDAAFAPGVSALNPTGLTPRQGAVICELAGNDARVRHFDLMELCPPHDEQGRTARVAAMLFASFVAGFARRGLR